jgi:acylphosphatase
MTCIVSLRIRGRVQGVGFRAFLREEARAAGLSGWVRNCRDGTVEAVLGGSAEGLAQVRAAAAAGPPGARVDAVASFADIDRGKGGFWEDRGYQWYAGI